MFRLQFLYVSLLLFINHTFSEREIDNSQNPDFKPLAVTSHLFYTCLARPVIRKHKAIFLSNRYENLVCACPRERLTNANEAPNRQLLEPISKTWMGKLCSKNCKEEVLPFHRFTYKDCAEVGKIIEIGYEVDFGPNAFIKFLSKFFSKLKREEIRFIRLIAICHNHKDNKVIFIRHKIRTPKYFINAESPPQRINYQTIFTKLDNFYLEENQKNSFKRLFPNNYDAYFVGPSHKNEKDKKYFIMYQLVPHEDMVLTNWKKSTFYEINTIPVWNTMKNYFKETTNFIHYISRQIIEDPVIYSGTYGTLEISGVPIILKDSVNNNLPVPDIIWRLVYFRACKMGIVIVAHNKSDGKNTPDSKFCQSYSSDLIKRWHPEAYYCYFDIHLRYKLNLHHIDIKGVLDLKNLLKNSDFMNTNCMYFEDTNEKFDADGGSNFEFKRRHEIYSDELGLTRDSDKQKEEFKGMSAV